MLALVCLLNLDYAPSSPSPLIPQEFETVLLCPTAHARVFALACKRERLFGEGVGRENLTQNFYFLLRDSYLLSTSD